MEPDAVGDLVTAWNDRVARDPDGIAIDYFDTQLTARELDRASSALAAALLDRGVKRGERVGICLQNIPAYPTSLLALWKIGAIAVLINPMYRGRELRHIVEDAGICGMVHAYDNSENLDRALPEGSVGWSLSCSAWDLLTEGDPRALGPRGRAVVETPDDDFWTVIETYADAEVPAVTPLQGSDLAILAYTSGTTGPAKGAMISHANVLHAAGSFARCIGLTEQDVVLAMAPFFHITGAVTNAVIALLRGSTLVLIGRFHPEIAVQAFADKGVTFTSGSITAYNAMYDVAWAERHHFAAARILYSGGAPVPSATVERFEQRFGVYIHNGYGMTESTSAVIAVPAGSRAPIDSASGSLSVGRPLRNVDIQIVDDCGNRVEAGSPGQVEFSAPQVVRGYWRNPTESERSFSDGRLRTGDVGVMDEDGWIYMIDRLKDQINVSGYKVWPREVEEVLYEHPAVREAGVVGLPDEYRGEIVAAYVSLYPDQSVSRAELIGFVKERIANYKVPREVHVIDDLPKTSSGKIRRQALRTVDRDDVE